MHAMRKIDTVEQCRRKEGDKILLGWSGWKEGDNILLGWSGEQRRWKEGDNNIARAEWRAMPMEGGRIILLGWSGENADC